MKKHLLFLFLNLGIFAALHGQNDSKKTYREPFLGEKHSIELGGKTFGSAAVYYMGYEFKMLDKMGLNLSMGSQMSFEAGLRFHPNARRGGGYWEFLYSNSYNQKLEELLVSYGYRFTKNDSFGFFLEFGLSKVLKIESEYSMETFGTSTQNHLFFGSIGVFI